MARADAKKKDSVCVRLKDQHAEIKTEMQGSTAQPTLQIATSQPNTVIVIKPSDSALFSIFLVLTYAKHDWSYLKHQALHH